MKKDNVAPLQLVSHQIAQAWTDAYPVGNGRIGAMCFGSPFTDRIQINDATCWSGGPQSAYGLTPENGPELLASARAAIAAGDVRTAEVALSQLQSGYSQAYQPLVDLYIDPHTPASAKVSDHTRALDLRTATATSTWQTPAGQASSQTFASAPHQVLETRRLFPEATDVSLRLGSVHPTAVLGASSHAQGHRLTATVRMPSTMVPGRGGNADTLSYDGPGVTAVVTAHLQTDGTVTAHGSTLQIAGATHLTVILATATDAFADDLGAPLHGQASGLATRTEDHLDAALAAGSETRERAHLADHASLFGRVEIDLGPAPAGLSTAERILRVAQGEDDDALAALTYQYGRYLMVVGSRPGGTPLNLQGIWNESATPPWSSNYTVNINTEMNYWPAHTANLAECAEPVLTWLERVAEVGREYAHTLYDAPGWVAHHNVDQWGFAGPVGAGGDSLSWSFWPMGGVWLTRHLITDAEFTHDLATLRRAWPLIAGATEFALAWLQPTTSGRLGTAPSTSPENLLIAPDGEPTAVSTSTVSDLELIRDLFDGVAIAADLLHDTADSDVVRLAARASAARERLEPTRVLSDGRVAEWAEEPSEHDPQHRHQSHLIGLFPGRSITEATPETFAAARRSLEVRGDESTGWSLAWRIALWARLQDPSKVNDLVRQFLRSADGADGFSLTGGGVYRNLFCAHPPFQIDGNFGFTAGVTEALVQSHETSADGSRLVRLLAAAPWKRGRVAGIRARGGLTIDLGWDGGEVRDLRITADRAAHLTILGLTGGPQPHQLSAGEVWTWSAAQPSS